MRDILSRIKKERFGKDPHYLRNMYFILKGIHDDLAQHDPEEREIIKREEV